MTEPRSNPKRLAFALLLAAAACGRIDHLGKPPDFTPNTDTEEHVAMLWPGLPLHAAGTRRVDASSLWSGEQQSLLGDRRAMRKGDILTVVIDVNEEAKIFNNTARSRTGSESMAVPQLLGLPQRVDTHLPDGASMADAVAIDSGSQSSGRGSVNRKEELTLRVAATVIDVLPNGILSIRGSQELRVNFEMRELYVSGYVRPGDISRKNEITFDKIASARVSYGGRGQITDVQQPRYGQQILDMVLPF